MPPVLHRLGDGPAAPDGGAAAAGPTALGGGTAYALGPAPTSARPSGGEVVLEGGATTEDAPAPGSRRGPFTFQVGTFNVLGSQHTAGSRRGTPGPSGPPASPG